MKDKGINELIAAFKKLYSSHPNIRLVLFEPDKWNQVFGDWIRLPE